MDELLDESLKKEAKDKSVDKWWKTKKFLRLLSTVLLLFPVCLFVAEPVIMLFAAIFRWYNFNLYVLFFICSLLSLLGIVVRILVNLCLLDGQITLKAILKGLLSRWELIVLVFAFLWTFISCLYAVKQDIVWDGNDYNIEGFSAVLMYGLIFFDAYLISGEKFKRTVCYVLVLSGAVLGACLIYSHITGVVMGFSPSRSIYRNSNHYGYALSVSSVMAVALFMREKSFWQKILFGISFAILHANMLVCDCLGSLIGEIFGLLALFLYYGIVKRSKKVFICLLIIVLVFVGVSVLFEVTKLSSVFGEVTTATDSASTIIQGGATGSEGSSRWRLWTGTVEVIKKAPLFGKGLDCYWNNNVIDSSLDMPHNEYLQIASNVGLPALVFYLVAIAGIFVRSIIRVKKISQTNVACLCSALGYLVSAFFGNTFTYTYPFLLITLALSALKGEENGN